MQTSYLWLFRKPVLGIMLVALTFYTGWKYLRIGHLKKVDNTIKWDPISEDQERKI
jgi:superoxide dismutase